MRLFLLLQPQNPPQPPDPVPIAGGWILIIAGALYGMYYFWKTYKLLKKK